MSAPRHTVDSASTDVDALRRQIRELQHALVQAEQCQASSALSTANSAQEGNHKQASSHDEPQREPPKDGAQGGQSSLPQSVLETNEQWYQSLYDSTPFMYFTLTPKGIVFSVNDFGANELGYQKEDLVGQPILRVFDSTNHSTVLEQLKACATSPSTLFQWEIQKIRHDGTRLWVKERARAIHDHTGQTLVLVACEDITERKRTEEQVRESEARWRALYEHAGVGIAQLHLDGRFLRVNTRLCEVLGYSSEAMLDQKFQEFTHPDDLASNMEYLGELITGKRPSFSMEKRYRRNDHTWVWVDLTVSLVRAASGNPAYFIAVIQHIDDRKQAEHQLRESERAIRSLHDATSNFELTIEERIQTVLELGCRRFQLPIGMITRVCDHELELVHVHAPDTTYSTGMRVPLRQSYCGETLQTQDVLCFEHAGASAWSGHPGYKALALECYIGTILAGESHTHGTICFAGPAPYPRPFSQADKDFLQLMARWIAGELDRQKSEQALRTSELKFRTLVETTHDWVWEVNEQAVYTYASPRIQDILGYAPEDVIGKTPFDLMPPDEALRVAGLFASIAAAQRPFTLLQNTNRHKDGRLVVLETSGTPIVDEAGVFRGYHGIDRDITDRKQTEEALRKSEERFEVAFRSSPYPVILTERDSGRCLEVNEAALKLFGYSREEAIGKTMLTLGLWPSPDDRARFFQQLHMDGAIKNQEIQLCTKDQKILTLLVSSEVIELNGVPCLITVGNNVTEHKRAEAALRASEMRLQRFVAEAPVGLCILDESWRAISANRALCELTGYDEHEIVGSTYALYTHPEDLPANIALTDEFFRGLRSAYTYEKRYIRKSGEIIWVSVKATRIELSGHPGPLLLAAVQDITEQKLTQEEREQLSRDLHDNILQTLYAIGMQLEAGKLVMGKSLRQSKVHMTHAINQLNHLMLDVRRFIALLTQRTRPELDFGHALRQLITSMSGAGQSAPELDIKNPVLSFITPTLGEQLLNIAREALSNSMRHTQASHRWLRLSLTHTTIQMIIGDNGTGFSLRRKRRSGHGLHNMAARAKQLGAAFTLSSGPGKGTIVTVDIPQKKGTLYE